MCCHVERILLDMADCTHFKRIKAIAKFRSSYTSVNNNYETDIKFYRKNDLIILNYKHHHVKERQNCYSSRKAMKFLSWRISYYPCCSPSLLSVNCCSQCNLRLQSPSDNRGCAMYFCLTDLMSASFFIVNTRI